MLVEWSHLEEYIPDGSGYYISTLGEVFSIKTNKILKGRIDKNGYITVHLRTGSNKGKHYRVHRLVALAFIERIEGKNIVNHKDGNKQNNSLDNLEWSDPKGNFLHALENNLKIQTKEFQKKIIVELDKNTKEMLFVYSSIKLASKKLKINYNVLSKLVNKKEGYKPRKHNYFREATKEEIKIAKQLGIFE